MSYVVTIFSKTLLYLVTSLYFSTCFYALCFISKTPQGADILLGAGWTCVRHSQEEKWPLILEETIEEVATPSSPISPVSSASSMGPSTIMGGVNGGMDSPGDSHTLITRKSTPLSK